MNGMSSGPDRYARQVKRVTHFMKSDEVRGGGGGDSGDGGGGANTNTKDAEAE